MNRPLPRYSSWVVNQVADDDLAGDLKEDFQSGRSRGWYRRQAIAAIVHAIRRDARAHPYLAVRAIATGWCVQILLRAEFFFEGSSALSTLAVFYPIQYLIAGLVVGHVHRAHRLMMLTAVTFTFLVSDTVQTGLFLRAYANDPAFLGPTVVLTPSQVFETWVHTLTEPLLTLVGGAWPMLALGVRHVGRLLRRSSTTAAQRTM